MQRDEVVKALGQVAQASRKFRETAEAWRAQHDRVLKRLINEAAANMMSVEDVSRASNLSPSRVRALMRANALNPKMGKRLLAKTASDALISNAELLGIDPREMDLMSPLAYLPAGSILQQAAIDGVLAPSRAVVSEPLEMGLWCEMCGSFEQYVEDRDGECRACGCALSSHIDVKITFA